MFQAKEELKLLMDKNNNSGVKGLAEMDTRLSKLNKRVAEMEAAMSKLEKVNPKRLFCQFFYSKTQKAMNSRNISGLLLCWERKTNQIRDE